MRFFSIVSRQVFLSSALPYSGFGRIFPAERSMSVAVQQGQQSATWSVAWRPTGLGAWPDPVHHLHSRPGCFRVKLRFIPTSLRRRHSDFGSCSPTFVDVFLSNVNECVGVVADWMYSNRLSLNQDKTEFIWCTTGRSQHRLPAARPNHWLLHCCSLFNRS